MAVLQQLGWSPALDFYLQEAGHTDLTPGRIARVIRGSCQVLCAVHPGVVNAGWSAPLPLLPDQTTQGPAVGDWCGAREIQGSWRLVALLPRHSRFVRGQAAGDRAEQVIATNIDVAFLVTGLDRDYSPRRIERYLALTRQSGARAVIVLNKADLCDDEEVTERRREVERLAAGTSVLTLSALEGRGVDGLRRELAGGLTAAFLGSSGAGKSTLINSLLGEDLLPTAAVRSSDDRGRHTTTCRELLPLPGGGAVIDTPGLREVGVIGERADLDQVFPDVAALAADCRFNDCQHGTEPGCAVRTSAENEGGLDPARLESYLRLVRELESAARRQSAYQQRAHERQTYGRYHEWQREIRRLKGDK